MAPPSPANPAPSPPPPPGNSTTTSHTNSTKTNTNTSSKAPTLPTAHPTLSYWHTTHASELAQHRTTAELPARAAVVVVGSGVSGVFAARALLLAHGATDVVVLEARDLCSGATGRNGGHCHPLVYESAPEVVDFELQNFFALADLVDAEAIPCEFSTFQHGGCHAYYSKDFFEEAKSRILELKHRHPHLGDQLSIVEDASRLAAMRVPDAVGAVTQVNAASIHPYKLVTHIWSKLLQTSYLNLQTGTPVTSLSKGSDGDWILDTPRGSIVTSNVLLTTNAYTAYLLPEFQSLIVPVQGEMAALKPPPSCLERPFRHDYVFLGVGSQEGLQEDYLVQRPKASGGSFMFGGARAVAKDAGVGVSDDSFIDKNAAKYLRVMLPRLMDLGDGAHNQSVQPVEISTDLDNADEQKELEVQAQWTGIMGFSRDGYPWVGAVPGKDGVWVCGGYTGHGMPNAMLSAIHVASLVAASTQRGDWRTVEQRQIQSGKIPKPYVVSEERMRKARELPEIKANMAVEIQSLQTSGPKTRL